MRIKFIGLILGTLFSQDITESSVGNEAIFPGEEGSTVATILLGAANLGMSFPIGVNSILLGAFIALVLLLAVFPTKVFLDAGEIAEST